MASTRLYAVTLWEKPPLSHFCTRAYSVHGSRFMYLPANAHYQNGKYQDGG